MNIIPQGMATKFGRPLLHLQKTAPQTMFIGGALAGVAGVVLACRATLKVGDTLGEYEEFKSKLDSALEQAVVIDGEVYTDKRYTKDVAVIKARTLLNITKLYAPSAGLLILSAALMTGSHVTLTKRNASLTAAYAGVDKAFNEYRERVRKQLGEEVDREMRYDTTVVSETVEDENGKKKVVKHTRVGPGSPSLYAKFFDEYNQNWKPQPEYNALFLRAQQNYANNMLQARGHVFLNEVYDWLGIERTGAGAVVGWVYGKGGDDFIDFGVFDDDTNPHVRDFVNGQEASILLDFNVDGEIYNLI